jgi:TatD DNase family protein
MAQEAESREPKFFDAHTHVQFGAFDADRDAVVARALAAGVWMVNVGTQVDTSRAAVEFAERYATEGHEGVYAAVGLHPVHTSRSFHDADELGGGEAAKAFTSRGEAFDIEQYRRLALHTKTVAIGECGLDYFRFTDAEPREEQIRKQKEAFIAQIELSLEIKKPLMIHCRNAFADLIEILKFYEKKFGNSAGANSPGVIHFFTGTSDDARALLELGFSFTFGGAITFPPRKGKSAGDYDEVIKIISSDRILSETDAPYVAPAAHRGQRNEPAYIPEIVKKLAELKNISPEEMKAQIWENAKRVFRI